MKIYKPIKLIGMLAISALLLPQISYAVGTTAGTNVTNTATLQYSVGGSPAVSVDSNTTDFEVDQVLNFQITETGADVHAGATGTRTNAVVSRFTLSHDGNADQRFALSAANLAPGQTVTLGATVYTDSQTTNPTNTNVSSIEIYLDDGDGIFEPGGDDSAAVTFVDLNAAVGTVTQDIWVWATLPASAPDGENALVSLSATAQEFGTGNALSEDSDGDNPTLVEIVFNDPAGTDDGARDGVHSGRDVFQALTSQLSIAKSATTIWDPVNAGVGVGGTNDPLAIPGAYVRYSITIENSDSAGAAATLSTITDNLAAELGFDAELIVNNCADTGSATGCATESGGAGQGISLTTGTNSCTGGNAANARAAATTYFTSASDGDAGDESGGTVTVDLNDSAGPLASDGTHPNDGDLLPCETVTIEFNAIMQ